MEGRKTSLLERFLLALIFFCYFLFSYFWVRHLVLVRGGFFSLQLPREASIPFLPWTVYSYCLAYLLIPATFFLMTKKTGLWRLFISQMMGIFLCQLSWFLYPVRYNLRPPPELFHQSLFPLNFIRQFYQIDIPINCFPSLHVTSVFLCYFVIRSCRPRLSKVWLLLACLISLSTITFKQHYIADGIAGFFLALLLARILLPRATRTSCVFGRSRPVDPHL